MELIVVVRCETCICSSDQLIFQLLKNYLQNFQSHLYYYVLCIHHCSFGMTLIILMIGCLQVGDGQPMRLWRVSVEIESPPTVVLQRVLRERHLWDEDLLHSRVIETLENNTEVFHYITDSMAPHPRRNFIVLRYTAAGNFFFLCNQFSSLLCCIHNLQTSNRNLECTCLLIEFLLFRPLIGSHKNRLE